MLEDVSKVVPHCNVDEDAGYKHRVDSNNESFLVSGSNAVVYKHAVVVKFFYALVAQVAVRSKRFSHDKAGGAFSILVDGGCVLLFDFFVLDVACFFQFFFDLFLVTRLLVLEVGVALLDTGVCE
jgi:hypothetical protein